MKTYRIADLNNGPFGEIFSTLEAAEAELAACIKEGDEIREGLLEDEMGASSMDPRDFFYIVDAETGKEI